MMQGAQGDVSAMHRVAGVHWILTVAIVAFVMALLALWRRREVDAHTRRRERELREELQAYAQLDASFSPGDDVKPLACRVCRAVVERSGFRRVAMLVRDAEAKLVVAASAGLDDLTVGELQRWGTGVVREESGLGLTGPVERPTPRHTGPGGFEIVLGSKEFLNAEAQVAKGARRVIVTMMRAQSGSIVGALVLCGEGMTPWPEPVKESLPAIGALALKLSRTLENASLMERLLRAEKLAGLGQLAGGVAHELNNPLTAVLGYAELIAETSTDARVRSDAATIMQEALRMKETIENLQHFWRPVKQRDEAVELGSLLEETADACIDTLRDRGVRLVMQAGDWMPPVRGDRERLRQVLEHLLNNAAQAIAASQDRRIAAGRPRDPGLPRGLDEGDINPVIRVTARHDEKMLHLIVSDTGPGFREPGRVFDPFYTTRQPGDGAGLGLSICYGIIREHGGEISAYNLHPHGAAVVVELPVRKTLAGESEMGVLVRG